MPSSGSRSCVRRQHLRPGLTPLTETDIDPANRVYPGPPRVVTDYREFYRGRKVMITGGLGFIGSNLARQLVDLGADVLSSTR